jgi:Tol biopolymer transport system component
MLLLTILLFLGLGACDDRLLPPAAPPSGETQTEPLIYLNTYDASFDPNSDEFNLGAIMVEAVRPDGTNRRVVTRGYVGSSPRNGKIALASNGPDGLGQGGVWLADDDGSNPELISADFENGQGRTLPWTVTLGPDGRTVAWINDDLQGGYELRVNTPTRETTVSLGFALGMDESMIAPPGFSPDGRWIALVNQFSGVTPSFMLVSTANGETRFVEAGIFGYSLVPAAPPFDWAPDSRRLLYVGLAGSDSLGMSPELMVVDINSGNIDTLTHDFRSGDGSMFRLKESPRWLSTGAICYIVYDLDGTDLYLLDQARNSRRLTHDARLKMALSIGPDGHTALYTEADELGTEFGTVRTFDLAKQSPGPPLANYCDVAVWRR